MSERTIELAKHWRLVKVYERQGSRERDLLFIVNDEKEKAIKIGYTLGM